MGNLMQRNLTFLLSTISGDIVEDFSNVEYDDLVSYHNYKEKSSFKEKGKQEKQKVKKINK